MRGLAANISSMSSFSPGSKLIFNLVSRWWNSNDTLLFELLTFSVTAVIKSLEERLEELL